MFGYAILNNGGQVIKQLKGSYTANYLLVAGGGKGDGGGGGAGGFLTNTDLTLHGGGPAYTLSVGAGSGTSSGEDTVVRRGSINGEEIIYAKGGGAAYASGGSGGGAWEPTTSGGAASTINGATQGNRGGNAGGAVGDYGHAHKAGGSEGWCHQRTQ